MMSHAWPVLKKSVTKKFGGN